MIGKPRYSSLPNWIRFGVIWNKGDSYCEVTIESYQPASPSDVESYYQTTIDSEKESLHTIGSLQKGWPKQIGGKTAFHTQIKAYMGGSSVENEINIYYLMSGNTGLSIRTTVPQWENQKELEQTVDQILQTITFSLIEGYDEKILTAIAGILCVGMMVGCSPTPADGKLPD